MAGFRVRWSAKTLNSSCVLTFLFLFLCSFCIVLVTNGNAFVGRPVNTGEIARSTSSLQMISHRKGFNKLGKPADQRKALLRSLTTEVIRHGRIKTTLIRARAVRKHVDHMIELGKRGDLHARRQALAWVYDKDLVHSLFEAAPDRYSDRQGGYTRVLRTVARQGDNAKMAIIELV
jgi:large subunit ribosomal protein L17